MRIGSRSPGKSRLSVPVVIILALLAWAGSLFAQGCGTCGFPGVIEKLQLAKSDPDIVFLWEKDTTDPGSQDGYRVYKLTDRAAIPADDYAATLVPVCTDDDLGPDYGCTHSGGVSEAPVVAYYQVVGACSDM